MANVSLIGRMLHAVDEFEAGRLSSEQFERVIDFCMAGLERIGSREIHESQVLCYRLIVARISDGENEFIGIEQVSVVVDEMRRFLWSLPDGQDAGPSANEGDGNV